MNRRFYYSPTENGWQDASYWSTAIKVNHGRHPLLFLAKCRAALSNDSYLEAKSEFEKLYPGYKPGPGIQAYVGSKWHELAAEPRQGGGLEPARH